MVPNLKSMMEDLKMTLRAILISAWRPLTLPQLLRDFKNSAGYELPYAMLGYPSAEALITNIPDTVKLHCGRFGDLLCNSVPEASTGHVVKLVQEQNSKGKQASLMVEVPPTNSKGHYRHDNSAARRCPSRSNHARPPHPHPHLPVTTRGIPSVILHQVKHVVDMYPNGIDFGQFNIAYLARYGSQLNPSEYGFQSLEEAAKTMKSHIDIGRKAGCWLLYPLLERSSSSAQEIVSSTLCVQTAPTLEKSNLSSSEKPAMDLSDKNHCPDPLEESSSCSTPEPELQNGLTYSVGQDVKDTFIELLDTHSQGIWANELPLKYKALRKQDLNFHKLGFFTIVELVCSIPEIFTVYRPHPNSDWLLKDARLDQSHHQPEIPPSLSKPAAVEGESVEDGMKILKQVYEVLNSQPKGIYINELDAFYKACTGKELPLASLGCTEKEGLLSVMAEISHAHFDDKGILLTANPSGEEYLNNQNKEQEILMEPICNPEVPADVEGLTSGYTRMPIEAYFKQKEYAKLFVSHVNTPSSFYVQLSSPETTEQLDRLMTQLDDFYNSPAGSQYLMLNQHVVTGHVCVALYTGNYSWHRAIISRVRSSNLVEVYYVDYGSTKNVSRDFLRYMKKNFLALPVQAVSTTLAFMRSSSEDGLWNQNAKQYFLDRVINKALIGSVREIQRDGVILDQLLDTSGPEDIYIIDDMCTAGYAHRNVEAVTTETQVVTPCVAPPLSTAPLCSATAPPCIDPNLANVYQQYLQLSSLFNPSMMPTILGNNYQIPQLGLTPTPQFNSGFQKLVQEAACAPAGSNSVHLEKAQGFVPSSTNPLQRVHAPANPALVAKTSANPAFEAPTFTPHAIGLGGSSVTTAPSLTYPVPSIPGLTNPSFETQRFTNQIPSTSAMVPPAMPRITNHVFRVQMPTNPMLGATTPANPMLSATTPANPMFQPPRLINPTASVPAALPLFTNPMVGATCSAMTQNTYSMKTLAVGDARYSVAGPPRDKRSVNDSGDSLPATDILDSNWKLISSPDCKISRVKPITKQVDENDLEKSFSQLELEGRKRYIKIVTLTNNHRVFLINKDFQPYLLSADVSRFFWNMDVIKRMLRLHEMSVPSLTVTDQTDLGLFLELDRYNIAANKSGSELSVTLYPLESIPTILKVLKPHDVELMEAVKREIASFNPTDLYWKTPAEEDSRRPGEGQFFLN